jgi:hypothetical protein
LITETKITSKIADDDNPKPQFDLARVYRLLIDAYLHACEVEEHETSSKVETNEDQKVVRSSNAQ